MSKLAIALVTTVALTSSARAWSDIWRPTPWGWAHRQKARCSERTVARSARSVSVRLRLPYTPRLSKRSLVVHVAALAGAGHGRLLLTRRGAAGGFRDVTERPEAPKSSSSECGLSENPRSPAAEEAWPDLAKVDGLSENPSRSPARSSIASCALKPCSTTSVVYLSWPD
jgi:hypothetical protein